MIKDVQKISDIRETRLRYRKRESMAGLYFKEMLSKINGSNNKENNKESKHKESEHKEDMSHGPNKEPEGEGSFLDELC